MLVCSPGQFARVSQHCAPPSLPIADCRASSSGRRTLQRALFQAYYPCLLDARCDIYYLYNSRALGWRNLPPHTVSACLTV